MYIRNVKNIYFVGFFYGTEGKRRTLQLADDGKIDFSVENALIKYRVPFLLVQQFLRHAEFVHKTYAGHYARVVFVKDAPSYLYIYNAFFHGV